MPSNENIESIFTDVANAIRKKKETTSKIKPVDFADEITSIEGSTKLPNINDYFDPSQPDGGRPFKKYKGTTEDLYQVLNSGGTEGKWTDMNNMFQSCPSLTSIPRIDTHNVIDMNNMFYYCPNLTTIPAFNTSKVTNMSYMFQSCPSLTSIPQLDTSKVTNMSFMFESCPSLTSIPQLDTSKVTNMFCMFESCPNLTTIPAFNTSKVTNMSYMFDNCSNIEEINMININAKLDISACTKMQQPALHKVIDNLLPQTSGTKTLTLGEVLLPRVSEEYKTKAQEKGWTLK